MMGTLTDLLLLICDALLVPIIALLLGMVVIGLVHVGGFLAELASRLRHRPAFTRYIASLRDGGVPKGVPTFPGLVGRALRERAVSTHADKILDDAQLRAERLLARLQIAIRLGPMLGLAGTLIPLGPALKALADGAVDQLAQQLIVAFSTTVIGLVIGGVAFTLHNIRQGWYTQDLSDLAFLFQLQQDPA